VLRPYPVIVCALVLGAVLSPLLREPTDDGFPLSTYPMFAIRRPTKLTITYAVTEPRHAIAPDLVGSPEPLQAMAILERAVRTPVAAKALCERIAAKVAGAYADATAVRIVTGTHDAVDYLVRGIQGPEIERTRCEVKR